MFLTFSPWWTWLRSKSSSKLEKISSEDGEPVGMGHFFAFPQSLLKNNFLLTFVITSVKSPPWNISANGVFKIFIIRYKNRGSKYFLDPRYDSFWYLVWDSVFFRYNGLNKNNILNLFWGRAIEWFDHCFKIIPSHEIKYFDNWNRKNIRNREFD